MSASQTLLRNAVRGTVRGTAIGLVGTTAMTLTTWVQRRLRPGVDVPVDYDATRHVVTAASRVVRIRPRTPAGETGLFVLAHWGYGSVVATAYPPLRRRLPAAQAALVFFLGCQSMAFALLPALGDTPPPWRWRRDVLVSSLAHHAVYAAVVAESARADELRTERARRGEDVLSETARQPVRPARDSRGWIQAGYGAFVRSRAR